MFKERLHHLPEEPFCTYHQILFEPVAKGLKILSLSSNNYNLGLQEGDIITEQDKNTVNCDFLSVSKTETCCGTTKQYVISLDHTSTVV